MNIEEYERSDLFAQKEKSIRDSEMDRSFSLPHLAKVFATAAHEAIDQRRKYTNDPYIVHPIEVAELVQSIGGTDAMIAAAYLHDVVEDTKVTLSSIEEVFGVDVATLVYWLTDISQLSDGNRAFRKAKDLAHISQAPAEAKTIKLADIISNSKSIKEHDPDFWKVYRHEIQDKMKVLTEGNELLYDRAMVQSS